ncbi:MAG: hypothetical protein ABWY00_11670 [Dongiaceae bacterium]
MTRILGIDFSGAVDAGRRIWIAEARHDPSAAQAPLVIDRCFPAMDLPASGIRPDLALPALLRHITALPETIAGCDFPFSLPAELLDAVGWIDFITGFPVRFPDHEAYRLINRTRTNLLEIKRRTDRLAGTPFNSYNLRLYRQAWWGMAHLLHPLVTGGHAIVVPQMPVRAAKPLLMEVCAACSLKHLDCYPAYKGRTELHRRARRRILDCLVDHNLLAAPKPALRRLLLDNAGGDALDAVIGAVAAARADHRRKPDRFDRLEGRVFFEMI